MKQAVLLDAAQAVGERVRAPISVTDHPLVALAAAVAALTEPRP